MGSYEIDLHDYEKFENSLVFARVALFNLSLFAVTGAVNHIFRPNLVNFFKVMHQSMGLSCIV